ncbi:MAG: hypothetical protein HRF50_02415 [Phycisphaerae bacterium]|jgi:hypothetical protein
MNQSSTPSARAEPKVGPPTSRGAAALDWLWDCWQRGGWTIVLPLLALAALAGFRGRDWRPFPLESVLAREPRTVWLLAACAGAAALLALLGHRRKLAVAALICAGLVGALVNALEFNAADPFKKLPMLHRLKSHELAPLGIEPGWYNHWRPYRFYAALYDVMRGSRIVSYRPERKPHESFDGLFHGAYRRYMSEIREIVEQDYDSALSDAQYAVLRDRLSEPFEDLHTQLTWRIALTPGPLADEYRVMRHGTEHLLVRENTLRELRGGG